MTIENLLVNEGASSTPIGVAPVGPVSFHIVFFPAQQPENAAAVTER